MISTIEIKCNAANPQMPLKPLTAFKSSPSSIRVMEVPRKIGNWNIDRVYVQATYPDGHIVSRECVRTGNVWVGTLDGSETPGISHSGFAITASGTDENGQAVEGYILGAGDVVIMELDGSIYPGESADNVRIFDSIPENPKKGDAYFDGGILKIYDGTAWNSAGSSILPYSENPAWAANAYTATKASFDILNRQINTTYAAKTEIPKNVSDLSDDIGIVHFGENNTNNRDVTLKSGGGLKTGLNNNGINISRDGSYNNTYLNYGYGQVIDTDGGGTLQVGYDIQLTYDDGSPVIKLGENTVVDDYYLANRLSFYATKTDLDNAIGNVLTAENF